MVIPKIETSIKELDELVGGGIKPGSNILIYGPPLTGKAILLMKWVYGGAKHNTPGAFVLTDYTYTDWKKRMLDNSMPITSFEQKGLVKYIDCYSKQCSADLPHPDDSVIYVNTPTALNEISISLSKVQVGFIEKSEYHRIAFHSLSSIMESVNPQTTFRFLQFVIGRLRKAGATTFFTLEKGMHEEKNVNMVKHLMDGFIEIDETGGSLRVMGFRDAKTLDWVKFKF